MRTYRCGANNMLRITLDPIERVLAHSEHRGNGCIEWSGHTNSKGYGLVFSQRKGYSCHRLIWEHVYGEIPEGQHVLHDCDNPRCVNPRHLFLGTNRENIDDKCAKDRSGKKLSISKVFEIKQMLATGVSQIEIARRFGVHQSGISKIQLGQRWAHVASVGG